MFSSHSLVDSVCRKLTKKENIYEFSTLTTLNRSSIFKELKNIKIEVHSESSKVLLTFCRL